MQKTWFGYRIEKLQTVEEVSAIDLKSTDILLTPHKTKRGLYASEFIRWVASAEGCGTWEEFIDSPHLVKEIKKAEEKLKNDGFVIEINRLDEASSDEFIALYQKEVAGAIEGSRLVYVDVENQTKGKIREGFPVYLIGIYKEKVLHAGLVFYQKANDVYVTVGAKEKYKKIKGGFGGVIEKYLIDWCINHSIITISHGRTNNPAGLVAKSGLFEFKARYGYSAFPEGTWRTMHILNKDLLVNDVVFVTIGASGLEYVVLTQKGKEKEARAKYQTKCVESIQVLDGLKWARSLAAWLRPYVGKKEKVLK